MRLLGRLSIRARITLGSLLVGAAVLVVAAVALHLQVQAATVATDRSLATGVAAPFVADLRNNPDEVPDRPSPGDQVGIRTASGRWLLDTLPADVRRALPAVTDHQVAVRIRTGHAVTSVVGIPVSTADGTAVVWAAQDGRAGHETLERVDRSLIGGTLLALLAFTAAAWLLSTVALRPVARMRATAERISAGSSDQHLPVGPADDELAGLARTLNAFLDRQRADAARERQMVSDASHELRTPLAALTARLELAHRASGDAATLERELEAAEGDAARLVALAEALLALSRLDDARAPEPAPAAALVTELMGSVDRARSVGAGQWDIDFDVDVPAVDTRYALEPAAFARVVDNLVANALAAADGGTVRIALEQDSALRLRLRVVDDGPGVPVAFLPHAFERFARADPARAGTAGRHRGSGLGLALVSGIAGRAGGSAALENRPSGGAVATVTLPAV